MQVNPRIGLTFANGLRSFVRQDPDVILVGEIRDQETAEMAIQAALTGHLMLSTLHTNSAVGTIARMTNLGIDPFLIAQALTGIVSQRLVARNCTNCVADYAPPQEVLDSVGITLVDGTIHLVQARNGLPSVPLAWLSRARMGVYEVMVFDDEIRRAIMRGSSEVGAARACRA